MSRPPPPARRGRAADRLVAGAIERERAVVPGRGDGEGELDLGRAEQAAGHYDVEHQPALIDPEPEKAALPAIAKADRTAETEGWSRSLHSYASRNLGSPLVA